MNQVGAIVIVGGGSAGRLLATKLDARLGTTDTTRELQQPQKARYHGLSYYQPSCAGWSAAYDESSQ